MATLEQVVAFFNEFTVAEFEAEVVARSHPDAEFATSATQDLQRFFTGDRFGPTIFHRAAGSLPLQSETAVRATFQRRVALDATELEAVVDPLYVVAATSTVKGDPSVDGVYYVKEAAHLGLRFVARYSACLDCQQTGTVKHRVCGECHGRGWRWAGGLKMPEDGKPLRVLRFSNRVSLDLRRR